MRTMRISLITLAMSFVSVLALSNAAYDEETNIRKQQQDRDADDRDMTSSSFTTPTVSPPIFRDEKDNDLSTYKDYYRNLHRKKKKCSWKKMKRSHKRKRSSRLLSSHDEHHSDDHHSDDHHQYSAKKHRKHNFEYTSTYECVEHEDTGKAGFGMSDTDYSFTEPPTQSPIPFSEYVYKKRKEYHKHGKHKKSKKGSKSQSQKGYSHHSNGSWSSKDGSGVSLEELTSRLGPSFAETTFETWDSEKWQQLFQYFKDGGNGEMDDETMDAYEKLGLETFFKFFEDKNKMLLEKHGEAESPKTDEEWEQFYEWFDLEKFFNFVKEKTGFGEEGEDGESSFVLPSDEELLALHEEYKKEMFEKLEEDGETKPLWWDWFSGSENEGEIDGDGDGEEDSEGDGEGDGENGSEGEDGESEEGNGDSEEGDGEEGADGEGNNEDEELVKPPWWKDSGRETNSPTPFIMDTLEEEGEDGEGEGQDGEGEGENGEIDEGDGGGNEPPPPPEKPKVGCWMECTGPCCELLENGDPNSGVVEPWEAIDASNLWIGGPEGQKRFHNTNRGWFQAGAQQTITRDDCLIPGKKYILSLKIQLNRDGQPFGCTGIKWRDPDSCPAFSFMYNNGSRKKWHAILNAPGQKFPLNNRFDLMRVPFNMPKDFKADGETYLKFRGVGAGVDILFKNVSLKPCNHSPLVDEE